MLTHWNPNHACGDVMTLHTFRESLSAGTELYALPMVFWHVLVIVGYCVKDHLWHTMHVAATSGVP